MHISYFHHCAVCAVSGAKPLPYVAWLKLTNTIEQSTN